MNHLLAPAPFTILPEAPVELTRHNSRTVDVQDKRNGIDVARIGVGRFLSHDPALGALITAGKTMLVVDGVTLPVTLYHTTGGYMVEHEQAYGRYVKSPYHESPAPLVELLARLGLQPYSFTDSDQKGTYNGFTLLGLAAEPADVRRILRLLPTRHAHVK